MRSNTRRTISLQLELYDRVQARATADAISMSQIATQLLERWLAGEISLAPAEHAATLRWRTRRARGIEESEPCIGRNARHETGMTPIANLHRPKRVEKTPGLCAICAEDSLDVVQEPLGRGNALVNVCVDCRTHPVVEGRNSFGAGARAHTRAKHTGGPR